MQTKIEKIGQGFGLLLPKQLLDACGFGTEATITMLGNTLILTPQPRLVRQGWEEALRAIPQGELDRDSAELGALRETPHPWDGKEWQWPGSDIAHKPLATAY